MNKKQNKNALPNWWCFPKNNIELLTLALVLLVAAPRKKDRLGAKKLAYRVHDFLSLEELRTAQNKAGKILRRMERSNHRIKNKSVDTKPMV